MVTERFAVSPFAVRFVLSVWRERFWMLELEVCDSVVRTYRAPGYPERIKRSGPEKSIPGIPGRVLLGPAPVLAPEGFSGVSPAGCPIGKKSPIEETIPRLKFA